MEEYKYLKLSKRKDPIIGNDLEYVIKKDAVCIALFDANKEYAILVKQYRVGSNNYELEIPAGIIEQDENPDNAVVRELREETGYSEDMVEKIIKLSKPLFISPAFTTEKLYFYATKLKSNVKKPLPLDLDETENIEVKWVKIEEIEKYVQDTKTFFAINYFKDKL